MLIFKQTKMLTSLDYIYLFIAQTFEYFIFVLLTYLVDLFQ